MTKKLSVFLLFVSVAITVVVTALYLARVELVTYTFNTAMAASGVQLDSLRGLRLGWRGAEIDELVLRLDAAGPKQVIRGLTLDYALTDLALKSVQIQQAHLTLPEPGATRQSGKPPSLSVPLPEWLDKWIPQLSQPPLKSLSIEKLQVRGFADHMSVTWNHSGETQALQLQSGEHRLELTLDKLTQRDIHAALAIRTHDKESANIDFRLQNQTPIDKTSAGSPSAYQLTAAGTLVLEHLSPLIARFVTLPESLNHLKGSFQFETASPLPALPQTLLEQGLSIHLSPATQLHITYRETPASIPTRAALALQETATLKLLSKDDGLQIAFSGPKADFEINNEPYQFSATGHLSDITCEWEKKPRCTSDMMLTLASPEASYREYRLRNLTGHLEGRLALTDRRIDIQVMPGDMLRIEALSVADADMKLHNTGIAIETTVLIQHDLDTATGRLTLETLSIDLPQIKAPELTTAATLQLADIGVTWREQLNAQLNLQATTKGIKKPGVRLPDFGLKSAIDLQGNTLSLKGTMGSDKGRALLDIKATHDLSSREGRASLTSAKTHFDQKTHKLSSYFSHWPLEADIQAGSWTLNTELNWKITERNVQLQGDIAHKLEELAGFYKSYVFVGLNGEIKADIHSLDKIVATSAAPITVQTLDVGIPVSDIAVNFTLDTQYPNKQYLDKQQRLDLHNFQARLFSGRVLAEDFVYLAGSANHLNLRIEGIDIQEILTLADFEGVQCSGKINGLLPMVVTDTYVDMEGGKITSVDPGGVFRYTLNNEPAKRLSLGENIQTQLVNQILSNYHYHSLQADASYSHEEDLLRLQVRMQGQNPDIGKGFPANFNPTVETTVLPLLEAHLASRAATDLLEKKLEQR